MPGILKLRWTGIRPLLNSNPRTIKTTDEFAIEGRRLSGLLKKARRKEDEAMMAKIEQQMIRNDWEASTYWDAETKQFYIPDTYVLNSIKGALGRRAKDVDRYVIVSDADDSTGGADSRIFIKQAITVKSLDEAFEKGMGMGKAFRKEGPCRIPPVKGALVWKCRFLSPTGWQIEFTLEFDESAITESLLIQGGIDAGRIVGIGSWRPKFGRFIQEVWDAKKGVWITSVDRLAALATKK